jgi:uncharacterized membrane protein YhhN
MRASTLLFAATVAISASFAIVAAHRDDRSGFYLFKPLTTFIILLGAAWLVQPAPPLYRHLVVLGLALSLAGDVFLMLPGRRFVAGLAAFLLAHLAYIAAFGIGSPVAARQFVWLLPFIASGAVVATHVWGALGTLKVPLVLYVAVICAMAWRAAMRGQAAAVPHSSFLLAFAGACLFVLSDAILAVRRFRHPSRMAHSLELSTYWVAQFLIAMSVRG